MAIARLAAMMAFAPARQTFKQFHEWAPSCRAALRMIDAVGADAKPFLEQAPAPKDDGEILVIQVDGRAAPMITPTEHARRAQPRRKPKGTKRKQRREKRRTNQRPRRRRGDKSKNGKVAVLGVIYTLRKTKDGYEGPINKQVIGTFESHRALMQWLRRQANKRGHGRKKTLFLADASEHIWREQAEFLAANGMLSSTISPVAMASRYSRNHSRRLLTLLLHENMELHREAWRLLMDP